MHMAWMRQCLRTTKKRLSLFKFNLVYNNFPWAENPTAKQIKIIEEKAAKVLETRAEFSDEFARRSLRSADDAADSGQSAQRTRPRR